jgi:hypothetical protein
MRPADRPDVSRVDHFLSLLTSWPMTPPTTAPPTVPIALPPVRTAPPTAPAPAPIAVLVLRRHAGAATNPINATAEIAVRIQLCIVFIEQLRIVNFWCCHAGFQLAEAHLRAIKANILRPARLDIALFITDRA